jgi:glucose-6-phosphate isomerase
MAKKDSKESPKKSQKSLKHSEKAPLTLDYNNLTAEALGEGIGLTANDLTKVKKELALAAKDFLARQSQGKLPFTELPADKIIPKQCLKLAENGRKKFDTVVVLGIGGSALGSNAVYTAIGPKNKPSAKQKWPKLVVADNIDPEGFSAILDGLDLSKSYFNVISKSGATAETMSQFMVIHDRLQKKLGRKAVADHLLVTTDPENGVLRKLVKSNGYTSLPIPPGVGGRFSVLTAVGLAPLAMAGVDIAGLLKGAELAQKDFQAPTNIALLFAGLNFLLTTEKKKGSLVMMPYSDALARVADWFGQLWNESLGKAVHLDGSPAGTGQTAIKALGVTDQHSQLQLYMEGPKDKAICFLGVESFRAEVPIPSIFKDHAELAYLGGHSLGEVLYFERLGTARALSENQRPNFSLTMPVVSPVSVGYLLQTLMLATVISGTLYGVDPLDQPGVELGKKFTYGLIGREGFSEMSQRYYKGFVDKEKYVVKGNI